MSKITIISNGGLKQAYQTLVAKDIEKEAILKAEIVAAKEAVAIREKKIIAKIESGEACSRCYRLDRKEASETHTDDKCRSFFCEECYEYALEHKTGSRKFASHNTSDCIFVIRRDQRNFQQKLEQRQRQFLQEMESESEMIRRLKRERAVAMRAQKVENHVQVSESIKSIVVFSDPDFKGVTPAEAKDIWGKKSAHLIAESIKKAEDEKALKLQKEVEEVERKKAEEDAKIAKKMEAIENVKKMSEDKIAEKNARLTALQEKIRVAKARAKDAKLSKSQQKKICREVSLLNNDAKSLTIEIVVDKRQLRETLRHMK